MTPREFILKWRHHALTERGFAQEHFIDLCRLLNHPTPAEADPKGEVFAFEKGATKTGGGDGWADVWKKGHFAWEYKKRKRSLDEAMAQLARYAAALDNPPIHVACDSITFRIETRFTNTVVRKEQFDIEQLLDDDKLALLRAAFHDPESLRPKQTRESLTKEAASKFQAISDGLQHRHADREAVAHFVNQLVFCFFANSVKLLPEGLLVKLIDTAIRRPHKSKEYFDKLFAEMERGGEFDLTEVRHFNGGLFDGRRALELNHVELGLLRALHSFRWDLIDPTIFGTLFERFLDPDKRAQIGAHYTDSEKIMMIVEPVILRPLRLEWAAAKAEMEAIMRPLLDADGRAQGVAKKLEPARAKAMAIRDAFIDRLCALRILDPACGSGNFLYLALQGVRDLEWRAILDGEAIDLGRPVPRVSPAILHGIEINPLAAELARTVIWIGDIQWDIRNGLMRNSDPILRDLDSIECRDALVFIPPPRGEGGMRSMTGEGSHDASGEGGQTPHPPAIRRAPSPARGEGSTPAEASWPEAEFIIGNPPFLGGKKLRRDLGDAAVERLFAVYDGRVPREADLVCYWFEKAWSAMQAGRAKRVGLVSTNSIRGGANRRVLEPIAAAGRIFEAWSDEPWVVDGAAVRVSLVCFGEEAETRLDGKPVERINADLSGAGTDVTQAQRLKENERISFIGIQKTGPFDIEGKLARAWLQEPLNPNSRPNSDLLHPYLNGMDVMRPDSGRWLLDFGDRTVVEASLYEQPFHFAQREIEPFRAKSAIKHAPWWKLWRPRPEFFSILGARMRYLATAEVSKHRAFIWIDARIRPDKNLTVFARDDDTTFGILHSRFHEAWSLRLGTSLEDRPRYTPTTTFETFPFPEGLTPNIPAADYAEDPRAIRIAEAAKRLDELRRNWLYPADLGEWQPEITPTAAPGEAPRRYPDRFVPRNVEAQAKLKLRTLTSLYNQRPQWLADAHAALDRAVAAAYGWPEDIGADEALEKLLALNLARAAAGR